MSFPSPPLSPQPKNTMKRRRKLTATFGNADALSMNKFGTSLSFFVLASFLLCSPFVQTNPDSSVSSDTNAINGFNLRKEVTLLESFIPSSSNKCSAICIFPDSDCRTNPELNNQEAILLQKVAVDREEGGKEKKIEASAYVVGGLEKIRNKTMETTKKSDDGAAQEVLRTITHRLEPSGEEYNYAASTKGAKVLAHNKEVKGAGNILEMDEDKYLRNPCSIDVKFVVVELSEETLVDSFKIANLEHYSSNFKDFELLGSLAYPTDTWFSLGNFTAENVKHAQRFTLMEPKWVRYMKLRLKSHYGSEFYCTLSFLEVYGVDAIEKMLEDFIAIADETAANPSTVSVKLGVNLSEKDVAQGNDGVELTPKADVDDLKKDVPKSSSVPNVTKSSSLPLNTKEVRQQLAGRVPNDTVLKILMQKLRSLELSLSVLEEFTKELDRIYGGSIPKLRMEVSQNIELLEKLESEVNDLMDSKETMEKEIRELQNWKSSVSAKVDSLIKDNAFVRDNVEEILHNQEIMENKELAVLIVSLFFACFSLLKITCDRIMTPFRVCEPEKIYRTSRGWFLLFVSSSMAALITFLYS